MKQRIHNEWFQPVKRKSCPCGSNRKRGVAKVQVWAWGNYTFGIRWHTVDYFCEKCFESRIIAKLLAHKSKCGCDFSLQIRTGHGKLPPWIKMPEVCDRKPAEKPVSDNVVVQAVQLSPWEQMQRESEQYLAQQKAG